MSAARSRGTASPAPSERASPRSTGPHRADLDAHGCAMPGALLSPSECAALAALYADEEPFRSRVVMARHGFGRGEYKYFAYPLPDLVAELRTALYPRLARDRQPLERAHGHRRALSRRARRRSSPAATRPARRGRRRCCCSYGAGDYNCLHQDLYGEHVFPLQVGDPAVGARAGLHRRRVRADRAAAAHAVAGRGGAAAPGRRRRSSPSTTGRCTARAASTASTCATA